MLVRLAALFCLLPGWAVAVDDRRWIEKGWSAAALVGPWSNNDTSEIFFEGEWRTDSGLALATVNKELFGLFDPIVTEAELHAGRHFGGQSQWDTGAVLLARIVDFPWNDSVHTTFAGGYGFSYSTGTPTDTDVQDGSKLLSAVVFELTAGPPDSNWSGVLRYQHRSSSFGLFGDGQQDEGTGFLLGLRYRFP